MRIQALFAGIVLVFAALVVSVGCARSGSEAESQKQGVNENLVVVDIAPMRGIIGSVVRDGVEVRALVPPGVSPHGFSMRPSDAAALSESACVVQIGLMLSPEIERAIKAVCDPARVVSMADVLGIESEHDGHNHAQSHDDHANCLHDVDPHLWLDPALIAGFLDGLSATAISGLLDEQKLRDTLARVRALDSEMVGSLEPARGSRIITQHSAFNRLAERCGIEVVSSVRGSGELDPSPASVAALAQALREESVDMVYVEPQFPDALAQKLADDAGVRVMVLDPLGDGDWFAMMRGVQDALAELNSDGLDDG